MRRLPQPGTAGYALVVLCGLNFVDQADSAVIGVLAPEVKDAFGMSNTAFGFLLASNFLLLVLGSVYVGYLGDRVDRRRIVQVGAFVAGVGSIFTGLASVLWVLVLARLVNGAGILVNGSSHKSLLADSYPSTERGRVFSLHEAATPAGQIVAPLVAGGLAAALSWRVPFVVLGIPILVFFVLALKLREPVRGESDDADEASEAALEAPVPFQRAVRMLAQSRTIRHAHSSW